LFHSVKDKLVKEKVAT